MPKLKIKNPFAAMFLDKVIDVLKPLNISSVAELGESQITPRLKKSKIGKSYEKLSDLENSKIKPNSFDLVIISDFLNNSDSKKIYKEAQKISSKYILVTQKTNPFNFFPRNRELLKIVKVRGIKIVSKKILPTGIVLIVKKQGNRA